MNAETERLMWLERALALAAESSPMARAFWDGYRDHFGDPVSPDLRQPADDGGPLIDPDCKNNKHGSCVGDPCECSCHTTSLRLAIEGLIATGEGLGREFDRMQLDYALFGDATIIPRQDAVLEMIRANTKQLRELVEAAR